MGNRSIYAAQSETALFTLTDNILRYGTYCMVGLLALLQLVSMDAGIQAVVLSGNLYHAVKTAAEIWPKYKVADTAENRLSCWFGERKVEQAAENGNMIAFEQVFFAYENTVLDRVCAKMDASKIHLIKGENGAGKSTFLELAVGFRRPAGGRILLGGASPEDIGHEQFPGKIFYLQQDAPVFDMMACEMYDMTAGTGEYGKLVRARMTKMAGRFGLCGKILNESRMGRLSGGERKKIFLAMAFAVDPVYLFLDEPTNHLDDAGKKVLLKLLRERNGGAVIISHDGSLDGVADCRWLLRKGKLYHEGAGETQDIFGLS